MPRIRNLVIGGAIGAATAYFFDPELGPARRARLQEDLAVQLRGGRREVERMVRELQGRASGAVALLEPGAPREDDLTVLSRVESVLFAIPGFPRGAVEAEVVDGALVLRGQVAGEGQEREIVEAAGRVPGVASVESRLRTPGPATAAPEAAGA